jgi:hypothetical protein
MCYEVLDSTTKKTYEIDLAKIRRIPAKGELITIETIDGGEKETITLEVLTFNSVFAIGYTKLIIIARPPKQ